MVSSIFRTISQVEHTKKHNSIVSESKSVKRNAGHQNRLIVCFYLLLELVLPYDKKMFLA